MGNKDYINKLRSNFISEEILNSINFKNNLNKTICLKNISTVTFHSHNKLILNVWDSSLLKNIKKSILRLKLNLDISYSGNLITIILPPLSLTRRKLIVQEASIISEKNRTLIRNIRRSFISRFKLQEKNKIISKDKLRLFIKKINVSSATNIDIINRIFLKKSKEIMN